MYPWLTSVPKSGTHLMRHILSLEHKESINARLQCGKTIHGYRAYPNGISGHMRYQEELLGMFMGAIPMILIRDPRDIIVSWSYHLKNGVSAQPWFSRINGWDIRERQDTIKALIETLPCLCHEFCGWLKQDIIKLRYERLLEAPQDELGPVAEALDRDLDELVERSYFRGGHAFRKGVVGEWKKEFSPLHKRSFNEDGRWNIIMEKWEYA